MQLENIEEFLGTLERGQTALDFTQKVRETLLELGDQGVQREAKGSVTLKLDFTVKDGFVAVTPTIINKVPVRKRKTSHMWFDEDGNPCTHDPKQVQMFERDQRRQPIAERRRETIDQD